MRSEFNLMKQIMVALSENGCTVWRSNTGQAYQGRVIHRAGDQVTLADSRSIVFGLCVGSSDIIGIRNSDGKFIAVEVKTSSGRVSAEQQRFIFQVQLNGGLAGIARSVDDAINIINK